MGAQARKFNKPWRYALAMFGLSIVGYMYQSYGTFFYNDKMGLSLAVIGVANILFSIWDAFNDPISGYLSDRTRTKWGRRRPWLMTGAPVLVLASILFFTPPDLPPDSIMLAVYFTVFLMLTETANTITSVNYHSLLPEIFRDTGDRNRANSIRQALQLVGMIIGVSLVPMIASAIGYQWTAILLGLLGGGLIVFSVLGTRERADFSDMPQPKLLDSLKALAKNRNFWFIAVSHFLYQATTALLLAGIPFFVKYALGLEDSMATILSAAVFVSAIPSMFLWYKMINRFGTVKVWRAALAFLGVALIPMFFANGIVFAAIAGVFVGVGIAGVTANLDMVNSELIEEDARMHGVRREATCFAGLSFVARLSGLVRSIVYALVFAWFAFESGDNPGPNPDMAAKFMMVVFPAILCLLSVGSAMMVRFRKGKGNTTELPEN